KRVAWQLKFLYPICYSRTSVNHGWVYPPCTSFKHARVIRFTTRLDASSLSSGNHFIDCASTPFRIYRLGWSHANWRMVASPHRLSLDLRLGLGKSAFSHLQSRSRALGHCHRITAE